MIQLPDNMRTFSIKQIKMKLIYAEWTEKREKTIKASKTIEETLRM